VRRGTGRYKEKGDDRLALPFVSDYRREGERETMAGQRTGEGKAGGWQMKTSSCAEGASGFLSFPALGGKKRGGGGRHSCPAMATGRDNRR